MTRDSEVLDGLQEIKDFIDPKGEMSMTYFKKNLLPGLKEAILIEKKGFVKFGECRFMCFKQHLMAYLLSMKKI